MTIKSLKDLIDFELLSFDTIIDDIESGQHFSLARYGDGEFNAILEKPGANCDGHAYYPSMGLELGLTLNSRPPYYLGLHQSAKIQHETISWLRHNDLIDITFVSNAVFHVPLRDGLFNPF